MEAHQDHPAAEPAPPPEEQVKLYASDEGHPATSFPGPAGPADAARGGTLAGSLTGLADACRDGMRERPLAALALAALGGAACGATLALVLTRRRP